MSGCDFPVDSTSNRADSAKDGKISVVCTIFPLYDWVRQILGDRVDDVELTLLLNNNIDLHSYQPTADDFVKISVCDLFIYVGGESDSWVNDALKESVNKNMVIINLLRTLGDAAKEEEILEGMQEKCTDGEVEVGVEDKVEAEVEVKYEYDEHIWLSLKNARLFCSSIAGALSSLDADNATEYENNLIAYTEKLSALDMEYTTVVNTATVRTLLFGDRFPFRYLLEDYNLTSYAAFPGCSAETEASFETVIFLANKADDLGLETILVTESSDKKIAETIISNTMDKNQRILVLDSAQSTTSNDASNGATYLAIMESNLDVLKKALGDAQE